MDNIICHSFVVPFWLRDSATIYRLLLSATERRSEKKMWTNSFSSFIQRENSVADANGMVLQDARSFHLIRVENVFWNYVNNSHERKSNIVYSLLTDSMMFICALHSYAIVIMAAAAAAAASASRILSVCMHFSTKLAISILFCSFCACDTVFGVHLVEPRKGKQTVFAIVTEAHIFVRNHTAGNGVSLLLTDCSICISVDEREPHTHSGIERESERKMWDDESLK